MADTLLIVEDEVEIAESLATFGRGRGFLVDCAFDGEEAISRVAELAPDVILLDIGLPGADGRDIMAHLQQVGALNERVVIFLTGRDSQADRLLGLKLGADDYETKPFNFGRLFRKIEHLLAKKKKKNTTAQV